MSGSATCLPIGGFIQCATKMVSFFGNISDVDYFLLAPKQCLSYMYLLIESVIKMTDHRLAMQRKVPLGGQKGAR
jgi:hypothetical protein